MSIQGSVNQLFTIGGSFAGMYGLLHPEIAQSRQIIHDLKGANTAHKLSEGYYNAAKDYEETEPNKSADYFDKSARYEDIAYSAETNIQKRIEENPSLLDNKKVLKAYEDKVNYDNLMKKFWKTQAQANLQTEGMDKVEQNTNYEQRRKDKGDV